MKLGYFAVALLLSTAVQAQAQTQDHQRRPATLAAMPAAPAPAPAPVPAVSPDMQALGGLQDEWARIKYRTPDQSAQERAIEQLSVRAAEAAKAYPSSPEIKVWQAIIIATRAGINGGLGALSDAKQAKDLLELQREADPDAPPYLIIIVDEFAALATEVPEFVDGVVNVAQRGRSLGLHLILATQRPAGVIKDNLRANTNLRVALRMADENDSEDVLGSKEAAFFDPALPGRAVSKTGPGRLVPFQTGYAGGWTSDVPPPPEMPPGVMSSTP